MNQATASFQGSSAFCQLLTYFDVQFIKYGDVDSAISLRRGFQLPTSLVLFDGDPEGDVVRADHAAPDHHVAGKWIMFASEVVYSSGEGRLAG
jgi:hypothetical protein